MVWIPAGDFAMGSDDDAMSDARPVHRVSLDGFWMDRTEVTNRQFEEFVKATGYTTVAEQRLILRLPRSLKNCSCRGRRLLALGRPDLAGKSSGLVAIRPGATGGIPHQARE